MKMKRKAGHSFAAAALVPLNEKQMSLVSGGESTDGSSEAQIGVDRIQDIDMMADSPKKKPSDYVQSF